MSETPHEPTSPIARRRGAQLGNANAVKHGFYSRSFRNPEFHQLDTDIQGKFDDEIALLRILILRTAQTMKEDSTMSRDEYLSTLRGITHAIARLESIYRTQKSIYEVETDLEQALSELKYLDWKED